MARHPLSGWQTITPVGPYGAHARLQHSPPHCGTPPSKTVTPPPPHTVPAMVQLPPPLPAATAHKPSGPVVFLQMPPQHSVSVEHASPVWVQNDGCPLQSPLLQNLEQHSPPAVHGLPLVLQLPLSGVHAPALQTPPQHSSLAVHAWLSATQSVSEHLPDTHENVQHSLPVVQATPGALQVPTGFPHFFVATSQLAEQHSPLVAQS